MSYLVLEEVDLGYPTKHLLHIDRLTVEPYDRIGLVGHNGSGKTSLIKALMGQNPIAKGSITRRCSWAWVQQDCLQAQVPAHQDEWTARWGLNNLMDQAQDTLSGGELTRMQLAQMMGKTPDLVFLDEPTSNLDVEGLELLEQMLLFIPTFILISHDRWLLNRVTNKTWEIREQQLFDYPGPYREYRAWLENDLLRREREYAYYTKEKKRLTEAAASKKQQAARTQRRPRKGHSASENKAMEFGAVGKSIKGKEKSLHQAAKSIEKRIASMEVKEAPPRAFTIKPQFSLTDPPENKIILEGIDLHFVYPPDKLLFEDCTFYLKRNQKTALTGPNGSGKTTLLRLIEEGYPGIRLVPKAKLGVFNQKHENLRLDETVLQNIHRVSCHDETVNRNVLARMGFKSDSMRKCCSDLSGGEQVKLIFAMLFVSPVNVLVLDEPTNYLDPDSIEAIENLLLDFEGTVLFVSHDREFVARVADEIWRIQDQKIVVDKRDGSPCFP